jgi:hypothetical protein
MPAVDSTVERNERDSGLTAKIFLVLVILQAIESEAHVIHGLWFKQAGHGYGWNQFALPVFIVVPALFLVVFRLQVKRWVAQGTIASNLAERIISIFGVALMVSYLCIAELAGWAFSAR